MFKHLFKLIWNQKKRNFLLMLEMMISFLVMFAVFTMLIHNYRIYKIPMGFESEKVWSVEFNNKPSKDSLESFYNSIQKHLLSMPQIESVCFSSNNYPFSNSMSTSNLTYKKRDVNSVNMFTVRDDYAKTMGMQLVAGRWYSDADNGSRYRPVVITESVAKELFGGENAIGKILNEEESENLKVTGVVKDIKERSDFITPHKGAFLRADSANIDWMDALLIKVKPGADVAFEGKLYKTLSGYFRNANIQINHLENMRAIKNKEQLVPILLLVIVGAFLVINVALGLFGVLWYNINKRKGEIGLRRAIGAPGASIYRQLLGEAMVLATIALVVGIFFAVQFPLLNVFNLPVVTYIAAIILSIIFIYILVIFCALYPGKQAAAIYPAVALHED